MNPLLNTMTDTELKLKGIEVLMNALGEVQAVRFISLILREPFNYTCWQRNLWNEVDLESLSQKAMEYHEANQ